jgi:hypothetical protein
MPSGPGQISPAKRQYMAVRLRDAGHSYADIGRVFRVTGEAARLIVLSRERWVVRHTGVVCDCPDVDCSHDEHGRWEGIDRTCSVCGAPIRRNSKTGFCTRTPACVTAYYQVYSAERERVRKLAREENRGRTEALAVRP